MARSRYRYTSRPFMKRWALAVFIAILLVLTLAGWRIMRPHVLEAYDAMPVMRLHVVPNSDSPADQAMKLAVRDKLLPVIFQLTNGLEPGVAEQRLLAELAQLQQTALDEVRRQGGPYDVSLMTVLAEDGAVEAVRVIIGTGAGGNWFCVLVPPLCFADLEAVERQPVDVQREGGIRFAWRWLGELFGRSPLPVERVGQMDEDDVDADLAHASPRDGDIRPTPE